MAVGMMSAGCRASLLCLFLLGCFFQVLSQGLVFQAPPTHSVFLRSKRANQFLVEELLQGNLERECYEELCNYEEAREYFEDDDKTIAFWTVYFDGDQCKPNPCLHGGNCTDKVGGFFCSCPAPYFGQACELGAGRDVAPPTAPQIDIAEMSECPTAGPTACHQLCTASYSTFRCSCLPGFKLQSDGRSCQPEVEFSCGQLPDALNTTSLCHHGNCPWQVSLLTKKGGVFCAGVVLGRRSILTTASCLYQESQRVSDLQPSDFYVLPGNLKILVRVRALYVHNRFRVNHRDNDLALLELASPLPFNPSLVHLCLPTKDFCENILMSSEQTGVLQGAETLQYMTLDDCRSQMNVSHLLSNKMFCMKTLSRPPQSQDGRSGELSARAGPPQSQDGRSGEVSTPTGPPQSQDGRSGELSAQAGPLQSQDGRSGEISARAGPLRSQDGRSGDISARAGPSRSQDGRSGEISARAGPSRSQDGGQERLSELQLGAAGTLNGTQKSGSGGPKVLKEARGRKWCDGLMPGTPVATVNRGTVFVTGLLMSSSGGCDGSGRVFTKLSRYLNWIKPSVEAAETTVSSQVIQYPEVE